MHHTANIYRCYADDAEAAIEVKARDREQAERIAAKQLRCEAGRVVARYVRTTTPLKQPRQVTCWMGEDGKVKS